MGLVQAKIEIEIETSPQLIESLHMARQVALKTDVAQVLPEHLQLAMLEDDESSFLLEAYGVDFKKVRAVLAKQAKKLSQPGIAGQQAVFSPQIEAIIQHAREQAQKNALGEVDSNLVLAVMLSEKGGFLQKQLIPYDLDSSGVLQYLELREGKTVTIDPLTPLKNIAIVAVPKPVQPLAKQQPAPTPALSPAPPRALAPTPTAPPRASAAPAPAPAATISPLEAATPPSPAKSAAPLAPAPAKKPPLPTPPIAPPQRAEPEATPFEQKAFSSQTLPPPLAPQPPKAAEPAQPKPGAPALAQAPLRSNNLTQPEAYGRSGPAVPPPFAPPPSPPHDSADKVPPIEPLCETRPPEPPAPTKPAPSKPESAKPEPAKPESAKKRSLFGGFGRQKKTPAPNAEKRAPGAPAQENAADQAAAAAPAPPLAPAPPADPAGSTMQAANHNSPQGTLPTNLLAPQASPAQSVDTLLSQPPVPGQPQTLEALHAAAHLRNRPAKRRRANPDSLGANESLSATGSVLEKGRLVENIPRRMKVNLPCRAQVRITRAHMDEINSEFADLSSSHIHELAVTEAMTVQLRAPGGGFHIENLSPQTQWIDRNQRHIDDADFGAWKWNVTPTKSGKSRLQLVISARTVDDEGNIHIADIPDKIIELAIARDHRTIAKRAAIVSVVGLAGLLVGKYGETAWHWVSQLTNMAG